ncbi:MAG: 3-keto-disaccharide hydrolase, partial [Pirellulales bacterium]
MLRSAFALGSTSLLLLTSLARAADSGLPTYTDAKAAGADFQTQGEYTGDVTSEGQQKKVGVQVIALGDGKFRAVAYPGGLPGDGWKKGDQKHSSEGKTEGGVTTFTGKDRQGRIKDGQLVISDLSGNQLGTLKKVERKSPTLGAKPPAGAVVLFDGTSADNFQGGKMTPEGYLEVGAKSKQEFGSCQLHIEFRTPFMPTAQG